MTLASIKTTVASYFQKTVADLTINGEDLFLVAVNAVRRAAELEHDFEFMRREVTVAVDPTTGGTMTAAVLKGTTTAVEVKTVLEAGLYDTDGNMRPVEWTTRAEGLERQRNDNPRTAPRYPTDAWYESTPLGQGRFEFVNDTIKRFPLDPNVTTDYTLGLEVYAFTTDWTGLYSTLTVTGTLSPDATGTYNLVGSYNGSALYAKSNASYFIWHGGELNDGWFIGAPNELFAMATVWIRISTTPIGAYTPDGANTGTATAAAGTTIDDVWTKHGAQYLIWATIVELNHRFKTFVYRQEGNLQSPIQLRDEALAHFVDWDGYKLEGFRRHGR